jgi:hypothetical protein
VGQFLPDQGSAVAVLEPAEVAVLTDLTRVMVALLDEPAGTAESGSASGAASGAEPLSADGLAAMVGIDNAAQRPDHPVLARLLPDGYRDDDSAANDFRRFTQADLRAKKLADARAVRDDLAAARADPAAPKDGAVVRLDAGSARTWLRALNDQRLALGTSLGVTDDDAAIDVDDQRPESTMGQIYGWLTHLQGTLIECLEPYPS